jgi:hypothetical protein
MWEAAPSRENEEPNPRTLKAGGSATRRGREADQPVGDEGRERAGLCEEDGKVTARGEPGEAVEPELRHVGADRGGGGQLRRHLPRRPRRCRHADESTRPRDRRCSRGHGRHLHRRGHCGGGVGERRAKTEGVCNVVSSTGLS